MITQMLNDLLKMIYKSYETAVKCNQIDKVQVKFSSLLSHTYNIHSHFKYAQ